MYNPKSSALDKYLDSVGMIVYYILAYLGFHCHKRETTCNLNTQNNKTQLQRPRVYIKFIKPTFRSRFSHSLRLIG